MISVKKTLSALLSFMITATSLAAFPANAAGELVYSGFESGLEGWTARGNAQLELSSASSASGSSCLSVSGRSNAWNGASHSLSGTTAQAGQSYSVSAYVMHNVGVAPVHFKLSLEYSTGGNGFGGQAVYDCIAEADVASGMWTQLSNAAYTIPADASNPVLYVETENSTEDFYLDEVRFGGDGSSTVQPGGKVKRGDVDSNGKVEAKDAKLLRDYLLGKKADINAENADLNSDKSINVMDLTLLKQLILNPPVEETTQPPQQTEPPQEQTQPQDNPQPGGKTDAKTFMAALRSEMTQNVPANVKSSDQGKYEHFTYNSKKAGHDKGAYYWLPPGYSESKKYNLLIMNHGIFGDESSMLSGFSVREMASSMISSGEAEPFIIIFTQMYTDPASNGGPSMMGGINMDVMDKYDDFVFDVVESIIPYAQSHWPIMTGREHTAIAGFSMGGRESLYCGILRPDVFGYVAASSPAPGIVPASDSFLSKHLGSYNWERTARLKEPDFKISDDQLPYLLMIGGGTNDSVVGTFPKQYHELFTKNGTDHIWMEVPNGGHDGSVGTPLFYNFFRKVFKA